MFQPGLHDEIETYVGYLLTQIEGLRESAYGLTEEQARLTPCRSALSIGGLLKHAAYVLAGRARRADLGGEPPTPEQFAEHAKAFMGSFALTEDETLAGTLAEFDRAAAEFVADVRRTDPGAETVEPPAPWDNRPDPAPAYERFQMVHAIEELARHAGHADIIREQIDGAQAMSLHFAAAGMPGNQFVQPWRPADA
ncbi:MAG: DinB family protein [Austwickia sp.]|jgi:hypothetical protein|nr:MAG: DinB family protein [Austwickia sp.]